MSLLQLLQQCVGQRDVERSVMRLTVLVATSPWSGLDGLALGCQSEHLLRVSAGWFCGVLKGCMRTLGSAVCRPTGCAFVPCASC